MLPLSTVTHFIFTLFLELASFLTVLKAFYLKIEMSEALL